MAEEGSKVKKGDVIIEMSNNSLSMQILQSEADLAEKQNILRNTLISMEQERLSLRQEQLQLDIDVERKRRDYERKERLYKNELLSQEEWLQAKEDYELALNKRQLNVEKQRQDSLFRSNQVGQMEESPPLDDAQHAAHPRACRQPQGEGPDRRRGGVCWISCSASR